VLFQSGGCCDGSLPLCLLADDLVPGSGDAKLGEVAGVPFYIDSEQFQRWGEPEFLLDVASGAPEGFSFGLPDAHFVTLSPLCQAKTVHAADQPPGRRIDFEESNELPIHTDAGAVTGPGTQRDPAVMAELQGKIAAEPAKEQ
jgi:uncharacterized protein